MTVYQLLEALILYAIIVKGESIFNTHKHFKSCIMYLYFKVFERTIFKLCTSVKGMEIFHVPSASIVIFSIYVNVLIFQGFSNVCSLAFGINIYYEIQSIF